MGMTLFLLGLLISGSAAIVLAFVILQHREANSALPFALVMIASAIWAWGYALQISAVSPDLALLAVRIRYIGLLAVPPCWLWFTLIYTETIARLTKKQVAMLAFFPVLTFVVNITNDWHHLFYRRINVMSPGSSLAVTFEYGPWYWLNVGYSYLVVLIGLWVLIRFWGRALRLHRMPIAVTVGGLFFLMAIGLIFYISRQFAGVFDITPLLLPVNGILLYLALFRPRLFDAHPVAYTHLFEQLNDGVLVFNIQGKVIDCNPAAYRLLGLTNPIGQPVQLVLQHIPQLAQIGSGVLLEEPLRLEYNEQVLDVRLTILRDRRGQQSGYMLVARDVSEQWRTQQALAESEAMLREERRLFIGGPTVIFRWEARRDWPVSYVSPNVQEQFGYAPEDFTAHRLSYPSLIHPEDYVRINREIVHYLHQKTLWFRREYRLMHADGEYRWVDDYTSVVYNDQGKPVYFLGYILDVTNQKRAEAERLEMERQFQHTQKLESLGVLASGVAHDFNNLLTAILGNLDLALLTLSRNDPAAQPIRNAMLATRYAAGLTRQLLAYAGKGNYQVSDVNLTEIVQGMAAMLRVSVGKQARLELHLAPNLPVFQADPSHIQQIVLNLILNAAESLPSGEGTITVRTDVCDCDEAFLKRNRINNQAPPGRYLLLEVADTGCGMDERTQRRMFDPFFTTKSVGRGLGMSAILGIVRRHHGAIIVDSAPGCGTTITVLFPPSRVERDSSADRDRESLPPVPSTTVLVVDDEADVRDVTARLLTHLGFRVVVVADGASALQALQEQSSEIVCVLLDANLAGMDAPTTLRELRALAPHMPVVVSSGYSQHEVLQRFAGQTIEGFIQKPYQMSELYGVLQHALRQFPTITVADQPSAADAAPATPETPGADSSPD
ncbi:MAG: PAS domain-containing protein [Roseiflexus sp.]|jgi:PAS domain S-box-containing protein|nr:PAS domain-containing protein [Roseiflexus sp.]MBO9363854.1 PAS domain-containing protein [Roseiflexus sp.]MBO9387555.1 PAS domain-containing protein [Roseiflexus sp.]